MSEILRHESPLEPPIAPVIQMRRETDELETEEKRDFSELDARLVIEDFICEHNHPSHKLQRGQTLAEAIERELGSSPDDPNTLPGRLNQLIVEAEASYYDDSIFDHKSEHDLVFQALIEKMKESTKTKGYELQRKVARKLLTLRTIENDETDVDHHWLDVTERLFISQPK